MQVLIVDDDELMLRAVARLLKALGHVVYTAAGGPAGLDFLEKATPAVDLVLSDIVMPGMDGPVFLNTARAKNINVPFVFMTGHHNYPAEALLRISGVRGILHKPFTFDQLDALINHHPPPRSNTTH